MKKFLLGCFTGVVFAVLFGVVFTFSLVRLGSRKPYVPRDATLVLRLEGEIPEQAPTEIPIPFLETQTPITVYEVRQMLRKAASDPRIKAVVFEPHSLSIGWARLQEIHDQLASFRQSGKALVAYLRAPGTREYYLATAADRIYMPPEDLLDIKGLRVEAMYLKGTLDKLGAQVEIEHAGRYKDAGDVFTRTSMTPETREVLNQILDQFYGNLLNTVAQGRHKQQEEIRALIEDGPFLGSRAQGAGLVDQLSFEDQVFEDVKNRLRQREVRKLTDRVYMRVPGSSIPGVEGQHKIALVVGEGEITRGSTERETFGNEAGITAVRFTKLLRQVENDSSIQGAIIRINSPGGDGIASDEILHEAKNLSKKKPVVISMGDLAASGGYFIAMTGDPVVAYPNTLTGSIGVIFGKLNLHGLYEKIGINKELLTRGRFAAIDSDYQPLSDEERQKLRHEIDSFYRSFVERVAEGRRRNYNEVEPLAQGRVWLGAQAKQNGLVDELGGLDRAIELIKQKAKIAASERVTLIPYPPKRSILEKMFSRSDDALVEAKIEAAFKGFPVRALLHGGILQVMPYRVSVH